jgi:N-acetylglucosaminyldiphosphoundecaprenol N-acetyl-beta-D-mannosaminyltransferase
MAAKKSEGLKRELNRGTYVIPDGIGLIHGAKIRGINLKERVTGYDTSMELLRIANQKGYGLYLLGGKEKPSKGLSRDQDNGLPSWLLQGKPYG